MMPERSILRPAAVFVSCVRRRMCNAGMRSQPFGSRELERGAVKACNLHFCIWFVYMIYMRITSLRARSHCVYALNYYFVIVTKYRKKCLTDQMLQVVE